MDKKKNMPLGIIIILILVGISMFSTLMTLRNPAFQLGPLLFTGVGGAIFSLVVIGILAAIFFGIIKRFKLALKLAIGWYVFSMMLQLFNLFSFIANNTMYNQYYESTLPAEMISLMTPRVIMATLIFSGIFTWLIGIIIIVYLLSKKDFFVN